jgi:DNA topoisomerase-2
MNGFGAKLANIFSTKFIVETQDSQRGKKFKQVFTNNMLNKSEPIIKDSTGPDFTRITFYPDFKKFGLENLDTDMINLFKRRVYDIAGVCPSLKVYLNDSQIKIQNFKQYVDLYLQSNTTKFYCKLNDKWEVLVCGAKEFKQVSFVNAICTSKGGTHVNFITDQICKAITDSINKKHPDIKPKHVKNHLWVFVNALIINPKFDGQTKDTLTSKSIKFASDAILPIEFLSKITKSDISSSVIELAQFKTSKQLKKTDGKKVNVLHIPKLDDANDAGGKFGHQCTLILTEGDSAKALAVAGLSVIGRDRYGVFPLKGKPLNVRDASNKSIMENVEITSLKQIIGLQTDKKYEDTKSLRYGHILIMADQDHDGSHIKGLIINFFQKFWPELFKMPGFLQEFITPIVKITKRKESVSFFTIPEYVNWCQTSNDTQGWTAKYYKGLGTSTAQEAKQYFSKLHKHIINFTYCIDEKKNPEQYDTIPDYNTWPDEKLIDMAFGSHWLDKATKKKWGKSEADVRKDWIAKIEKDTFVDHFQATKAGLPLNDFINKELRLFSNASNERAIPNIMDGLKPGQRKILFTCFNRKLKKEVKVSQLAGSVGEKAAYHHGEASLTSTIVNLAQNYVGSNNINTLMPNGQFGTRLTGGKDASSPRYIFTNLSRIARYIFPMEDDVICGSLKDDGLEVEPEYYAPIVPMVLINGSSGIGTGWSSNIPNYNPVDIVTILKCKLQKEPILIKLVPWYNGFNGVIEPSNDKYLIHGIITRVENDPLSLMITELPIGVWTSDYKLFLQHLIEIGVLVVLKEYHSTNNVRFFITVANEEMMSKLQEEGFHFTLRLTTSLTISNMVLYNSSGCIQRYTSPEEILEEYYTVRLQKYEERKKYLVDKMEMECRKLSNQVRFIQEANMDKIKIRNETKTNISNQLTLANYDVFPKEKKTEDDEDETDEKPKKENNKEEKHDFDYLLSMKIWNMTREKSEKFQQKLLLNQEKLATLKCTSIENMWLNDLDLFIEKYKEHLAIEIETVPIKKSKKTKVFRVPKTTDQIPIKYNPEGFKGTIVKSLESDKKQKTKSQKVKIGEKNIKMEKSKKVKLGESVKLEKSEKKVKLEQSVKLEKKVKLEESVKLEKSETPKRKIEVAKEKKEKKEKKHKKLKIEGN